MVTRREFLVSGASVIALAAVGGVFGFGRMAAAGADEQFEVMKSDDEWRRLLTPDQFKVLRRDGTEPPCTSPLLKEHRKGTFACAGCDLPLYASDKKFDSGTGWPSFTKPIEPAFVATTTDTSGGMVRTEVHCAVDGAHLGHLFNDGPAPTGQRYCMNSASLRFMPRKDYEAWVAKKGTGLADAK